MLDQQQIEELLMPQLQVLEVERMAIQKKIKQQQAMWIFLLVLVVFIAIVFYSVDWPMISPSLGTIVLLFLSVLFIGFPVARHFWDKSRQQWASNFEEKVKTSVYQNVFQAWNEGIVYEPTSFVQEEHFKQAALHKDYSLYEGDDYCRGQLADGRRFEFSELSAKRVTEMVSDNGVYSSHNIPVFKGLFFVLEDTLPFQGFDGRLHIKPTLQEKQPKKKKKKPKKVPVKKAPARYNENILDADLSNFKAAPLQPTSKKPIVAPFDRVYTVNSFNNTDLRDQLPQEFCVQMGYLRTMLQQQVSISFLNNKAYFSSRHQLDFWDVPIDNSLISSARVRHLAWNFKQTFMLLETIASITYADRPAAS